MSIISIPICIVLYAMVIESLAKPLIAKLPKSATMAILLMVS